MYITYLAGVFRSVRFGINEAHGRGMALQFNYLLDEGAFAFDASTGTFSVRIDKMKAATVKLTGAIMTGVKKFTNAQLRSASELQGVKLSHLNLTNWNLSSLNLTGANLAGANRRRVRASRRKRPGSRGDSGGPWTASWCTAPCCRSTPARRSRGPRRSPTSSSSSPMRTRPCAHCTRARADASASPSRPGATG